MVKMNNKLFIYVRAMSALVILLGLTVILGWHLKESSLVQIQDSFAPMQYNTAVSFLLSGIGLLCLTFGKTKTPFFLGIFVSLVGALTLSEYISGKDLGIDQLLMDHHLSTKTSHIGRMAPNTALCFFFVGLTLLLPRFACITYYKNFLLKILGSLVVILGLIAFISYVTNIEATYGWTNLTRMAVHTSVGFLLLGTSVIIFSRTYSSEDDLKRTQVLATVLVTIFFFLLSVTLWEAVNKNEIKGFRKDLDQRADLITEPIKKDFSNSILALKRMANRWEARKGTPKGEWTLDAMSYLKDINSLTTIVWVDKDMNVAWAEPIEGNEKALGLSVDFDETRKLALEGASSEKNVTVTQPIDLIQGYKAVIAYVPIHVEGRFDGFIVGIYNLDIFIKETLLNQDNSMFDFVIKDDEEVAYEFAGDVAAASTQGLESSHSFQMLNRDWQLDIRPNKSYFDRNNSFLPEIILISGALVSILVGFSMFFGLSSYQRAKQLKKKSEELIESKSLINLTLDNIPDFIFVKDKNLNIIQANKAFLTLYPEDQREGIIGIASADGFSDDESEEFQGMDKKAFEEGYSETTETITFPTGETKTLFTLKIRFEDSKNESFILGISRDVTEREKLIEKLTNSNEELERFAYIASHDLQEPVRMITSFNKILLDKHADKLDKDAKEYLKISASSALRMQELISDLLEYSKLGKEMEKYVEVDSNNILQHVLENLDNLVKSSKAVIKVNKLPKFIGNPVRFSRLVENLIANGLKYQKHGEIPKIKISAVEKEKEITFCVTDNGIGMKEEYCEQIFEPFKRLHVKEEYAGTGIGLAICRKIASNMGGKIWAESELGKGSKFYFTIPKKVINKSDKDAK